MFILQKNPPNAIFVICSIVPDSLTKITASDFIFQFCLCILIHKAYVIIHHSYISVYPNEALNFARVMACHLTCTLLASCAHIKYWNKWKNWGCLNFDIPQSRAQNKVWSARSLFGKCIWEASVSKREWDKEGSKYNNGLISYWNGHHWGWWVRVSGNFTRPV